MPLAPSRVPSDTTGFSPDGVLPTVPPDTSPAQGEERTSRSTVWTECLPDDDDNPLEGACLHELEREGQPTTYEACQSKDVVGDSGHGKPDNTTTSAATGSLSCFAVKELQAELHRVEANIEKCLVAEAGRVVSSITDAIQSLGPPDRTDSFPRGVSRPWSHHATALSLSRSISETPSLSESHRPSPTHGDASSTHHRFDSEGDPANNCNTNHKSEAAKDPDLLHLPHQPLQPVLLQQAQYDSQPLPRHSLNSSSISGFHSSQPSSPAARPSAVWSDIGGNSGAGTGGEDSRPARPPRNLTSILSYDPIYGRSWNTFIIDDRLGAIRSTIRFLARNRRFEAIISFLIFLNAAQLGALADWQAKHIGQQIPIYFQTFQKFFTVVFTLELLLRIIDERSDFFSRSNKSLKWNVFDSMLVTFALIDEILPSADDVSVDVSTMRVLRMIRLVRIFRVLRVMRFFRELRTMVTGIISSMRSLIWCLLLLLMLIFLFAVCIMQMVTEYVKDDPSKSYMLEDFGSMMSSIYTLYQTITGGRNWGEVASTVVAAHPTMALVFALYIAVAVLCVLNIVTGVFVENANAITRSDHDHMIMEEMTARERWIGDMRAVFERADSDGSGELNVREFVKYVEDVKVQAYLRKIGLHIDKDNSRALFSLVDLDGNGAIELEEFIEGCSQFVGNARQLDIARLRRDNRTMMVQMEEALFILRGGNARDFRSMIHTESNNTFNLIPPPSGSKGRRG